MAVVTVQTAGKVPWNNPWFDVCGAPGGCELFCYVAYCYPCAMGDVGQAAGTGYWCSFLSPFLMFGSCRSADDRQALAAKYNIDDNISWCTVCFCSWIGRHHWFLIQELNHIKAVQARGGNPTQVVVIQTPGAYPPQQAMGAHPPQRY